jgi:hypothetical protein
VEGSAQRKQDPPDGENYRSGTLTIHIRSLTKRFIPKNHASHLFPSGTNQHLYLPPSNSSFTEPLSPFYAHFNASNEIPSFVQPYQPLEVMTDSDLTEHKSFTDFLSRHHQYLEFENSVNVKIPNSPDLNENGVDQSDYGWTNLVTTSSFEGDLSSELSIRILVPTKGYLNYYWKQRLRSTRNLINWKILDLHWD